MRGYEIIDHTADIGIKVYGKDLKELFQRSAEALFEIICDLSEVDDSIEKGMTLEGDNLEQLMVVWLGELLYLYETKRLLFKRFEVKGIENNTLRATVYGEEFKEAYHSIKTVVKAVTYHQIQVEQRDGKWVSRVVFDL
ncbi:MAG: archease [Thermodesulfobacteriota bacterium]|nr:archease [Thermodesulfobacteriota bacterium]